VFFTVDGKAQYHENYFLSLGVQQVSITNNAFDKPLPSFHLGYGIMAINVDSVSRKSKRENSTLT